MIANQTDEVQKLKLIIDNKHLPDLFESIKGYNRHIFAKDLFAGVTVGVIALPLALAFAIASGVSPQKGIIAALIGGSIISLLGGSKFQIGGPTGAFIVIIISIVNTYGFSGLLCSMIIAGIIQIAIALCKLGAVVKFIPFPIVTGFTSGIGLLIFITQIGGLFGIASDSRGESIPDTLWSYWIDMSHISFSSTAIGATTIFIITVFRRQFPKVPAIFAAMVLTTLAHSLLNLDVATIKSSFGELPRSFPYPSLPTCNFSDISTYIAPGLTIALLGSIESLLSATVADGMSGDQHNANTELFAQGSANICTAFFGGLPVTGAIARTATNIKCGACTPISGLIHVITIALLIFCFAPVINYIAMPTLAGVLIVVCVDMSEPKHFLKMFSAPRNDVIIMVITFLLTVFCDLTVAIEVGVILASLSFIKRIAGTTCADAIVRDIMIDEQNKTLNLPETPQDIEIFDMRGPLFFGAAELFREVNHCISSNTKVIILRIRDVSIIDATGLFMLQSFNKSCKQDGMEAIICDAPRALLKKLNKNQLISKTNGYRISSTLNRAIQKAELIVDKVT